MKRALLAPALALALAAPAAGCTVAPAPAPCPAPPSAGVTIVYEWYCPQHPYQVSASRGG